MSLIMSEKYNLYRVKYNFKLFFDGAFCLHFKSELHLNLTGFHKKCFHYFEVNIFVEKDANVLNFLR